jgi:uncharacterized protein
MAITFDPVKRARTLRERGLDFKDAEIVFAGETASQTSEQSDYGEVRVVTAGILGDRMVVIVWTRRGDNRHIISMRYCHAKEERKIRKQFAEVFKD